MNCTICVENPKPRKSTENLDRIWDYWISLRNQLLVNGMSYFVIETRLLTLRTFRKDILPYELAHHHIFQNGNENEKVEEENSGVELRRTCHTENYFFRQGTCIRSLETSAASHNCKDAPHSGSAGSGNGPRGHPQMTTWSQERIQHPPYIEPYMKPGHQIGDNVNFLIVAF